MKRLPVAVTLLSVLSACPGPDPEPTFEPWTLEDLTAEQGLSVRVPEFEVPSGAETQDCYFFQMPDLNNGQPYWVNRFHTAINPGSHHLNVFRVNTVKGLDPAKGTPIKIGNLDGTVVVGKEASSECWKSPNWSDWPLVANSQNSNPENPYTDWTLPTNVATKFTPGEWLMLQTHYVNATTQSAPFRGKVGVNFHLYKGDNPIELGTLFATQQSLRICRSNPTPTYTGTCKFPPGTVTITAANGHFHSRGKSFEVYTWDGVTDTQPAESAKFYVSDRWDEPPMATGMNIPSPEGGGIWWNCNYQWVEPPVGCDAVNERDPQKAGDCCYTFGGIVETSEHCNVFLYYYPKVAREEIFCN